MMFGWFSCAASLASFRNIRTKLFLSPRCGRIFLRTTVFSKPSGPTCFARKISAIPPTAIRSRRRYFPNCCSRIGARLIARCAPHGKRLGCAPAVDDKLKEIEQSFERLTADLGNPEVIGDRARFTQISKERAQLEPLVEAFREY